MALLLETTLGDLVIDLDLEGSPELCKNVLKLAKARYYTSTLVYNVDPNRFCQLGDPLGDGTGGACIYGLIAAACVLEQHDRNDFQKAITQSTQRFLKSSMGRYLTAAECREKGRVVATEMSGIPDTIGSQFLITTAEGPDMALDNYFSQSSSDKQQQGAGGESGAGGPGQRFRSLGIVSEDKNNILDKLNETYCDSGGRPYADIRIKRALIIDDPFDDPPHLDRLLQLRGVVGSTTTNNDGGNDNEENLSASPDYDCPTEEVVEKRISADQVDPIPEEENIEKLREMEEKSLQRQDKSRATVLEMLGDLPSADITAPENVLFVCKLNSITEDDDLELIFSRFDEKVKAEIIRDPDTGNSLQYAFVEFSSKQQAVEAYFKMNNALVDDRRIKVDFSQSVAKVWDRYHQRMRMSRLPPENAGRQKKINNGAGPSRLREATDSGQGGKGPSGANNASFGHGRRGRGGAHDDFRQRNHIERGNFSHNNQGNGRGFDSANGDRRWGPSIPQRNNDRQDRSQGVPERPPPGAHGGHMPRPNERQREDPHHHMDKEGPTRNGHDDGNGHGRSLKNRSRSHERKRRSRSRSGSPTSQQQRTKRNRSGSPDHHKRRSRSYDRYRRRCRSRSQDRTSRKHKKDHKKDRRRHDEHDDMDRLNSKRDREGSGKHDCDSDGKNRHETEPDKDSRQRRDRDSNKKNDESRQRERKRGRRDDKAQRPDRTDERSSSDERQHSRRERNYNDDDEKSVERTNSKAKGKHNRRDRSRSHDEDSSGHGEKQHRKQRRRSRSRD